MRKMMLLALPAAALAFAGTAQAKEVASLKICGPSACKTTTDKEALRNFEQQMATGNPEAVNYTNPQRYYTIEIGFGDPESPGTVIHRESAYWLPDAAVQKFVSQTQDPWWKMAPSQISLYRDLSSGLEAFTPTLSRVSVAGKKVSDPNSYLRLLGTFPRTLYPRGKLHLTHIILRSDTTNPWVDRFAGISYDAKRRLLLRSDGHFRLPAALGKLIMKRASLASYAGGTSSTGGGSHTALYAGVGLGVFGAVGVLTLAGRKRIH
jgi:hypothetical protein